jgi:dihydrofolate synthase/folylpolyglutamate synthase
LELEAWLLQRYGAEKFRPGLERVRQFLGAELAALKALKPRIVTIAGTNGKGETAMTLGCWSQESRVPYVLWTSPHVLSLTERFRNLQGQISTAELQQLLIEADQDSRQRGIGLSYYEILWVAFVRWALRQNAQLWILEVGLGGRLDAVNVVDAQVVGLTSISRDHQEFLGNSYRSILFEKLGVVRAQTTLVSALESRYLRDLVAARLPEIQWVDLFQSGALNQKTPFSDRNLSVARKIWELLGYGALSKPPALPARGERWRWGEHEFVFYGSHNPDGMRKLVQFVRGDSYNLPKEKIHHLWAAFSQRPPQDLRVMVRMLGHFGATHVRLTQFMHPKAQALDAGWAQAEGSPVKLIHDWTKLFEELVETSEQRVLVTGSYYFVALVQRHLAALGAGPADVGRQR